MFLGDVGSYFAGAWLAVLVVMGLRGSIPVEAMLAPVALYMADTGVTLAHRVHQARGLDPGHRQHAYQRLVRLGWSHTQTTGLVFVLVALCSELGSVSLFGSVADQAVADCGIVGSSRRLSGPAGVDRTTTSGPPAPVPTTADGRSARQAVRSQIHQ